MRISSVSKRDLLSAMKLLHSARKTWALEDDPSKCEGSATFRAPPRSVGAGPEEVDLVNNVASNRFRWASS